MSDFEDPSASSSSPPPTAAQTNGDADVDFPEDAASDPETVQVRRETLFVDNAPYSWRKMTLLNPVIPVDTFELSYGYFGSGGIETSRLLRYFSPRIKQYSPFS